MSVINKMLRDLDQRQAKATTPSTSHGGLPAGTAALAGFAQPASTSGARPRRARPVGLVLAFMGLALVLGASWWAAQRAAPSAPVRDAVATVAEVPVQVPAQPAVSSPTPVAAVSAASAPIAMPIPMPAPTVTQPDTAVTAMATPVAPSPPPSSNSAKHEPATLGLRMDTTLTPRKPTERAPAPERAPTPTSELPKGPTPNEALERAQALWNTGSREAAIDLLQDALSVAERAAAGSSFAQGNPVLLPLVRELTRMQLAESRHGAVWDLLTRLEPQLGNAPDLWAIRGNTAQRLGRHQDSVLAYMAALQSRPNEQRWLLGAAVSLAALGQNRSAAEMADKARAVGVVSPEVLAYLRQMGVPLRDK